MSSKAQILGNVRLHQPAGGPLPEYPVGVKYDDVPHRFCETLKFVGGEAVKVNSLEEINAHLRAHPAYSAAKEIVSLVNGVGDSTHAIEEIDDPHQLANVDFAIIAGQFGVAENGAIWFDDRGLQHRVLPFITQHLAIVLSANEILHNMHEAYERIRIEGPGFGVFISGPSKTADIEQSLVIGAHGSRSLVVYLLDT